MDIKNVTGGVSINDYVDENFEGNKAAFARSQDVYPQTVTQWINNGYFIVDNKLVSIRIVREI